MFLDGKVWPPLSGEVTVNWTKLKEGRLDVVLMRYRLGFPGGRRVLDHKSQWIIQTIHLSGQVISVRSYTYHPINQQSQLESSKQSMTDYSYFNLYYSRAYPLYYSRFCFLILNSFYLQVFLSRYCTQKHLICFCLHFHEIIFNRILLKISFSKWIFISFSESDSCPMNVSLMYLILCPETCMYNDHIFTVHDSLSFDGYHRNDHRKQDLWCYVLVGRTGYRGSGQRSMRLRLNFVEFDNNQKLRVGCYWKFVQKILERVFRRWRGMSFELDGKFLIHFIMNFEGLPEIERVQIDLTWYNFFVLASFLVK